MSDCCNPMTGHCEQGHNCPAREVKLDAKNPASTPLTTRQGGERVSDGLPIVMFDEPHRYVRSLIVPMLCWVLVAGLVVYLVLQARHLA